MGSSLETPHPWSNILVKLTAHSAGFLVIPGLSRCGPPLTGSVRLTIGIVGRPHWWGEACGTIDAILGKEEHMAESTFDQVQRLVEQLSPHEQAHLLAFLALRMAQVVTATAPTASHNPPETAEAWEEFFRLGDALAASDTPGSETLTAAVLAMRR
jgi:hypothetical protein